MGMFTEEELEALRRADAEIEEDFEMTAEEYKASRKLDLVGGNQKRREQQRQYQRKNKQKLNAYNKAYRNRVMPNGKTYAQNWRDNHREELNARQRTRVRANHEKMIAYSREYYLKNRERILQREREKYQMRKAQKGTI